MILHQCISKPTQHIVIFIRQKSSSFFERIFPILLINPPDTHNISLKSLNSLKFPLTNHTADPYPFRKLLFLLKTFTGYKLEVVKIYDYLDQEPQ